MGAVDCASRFKHLKKPFDDSVPLRAFCSDGPALLIFVFLLEIHWHRSVSYHGQLCPHILNVSSHPFSIEMPLPCSVTRD